MLCPDTDNMPGDHTGDQGGEDGGGGVGGAPQVGYSLDKQGSRLLLI